MDVTRATHLDKRALLKLVGSSFAVRGLGVVCGFAMHVLLSRVLGAQGAGMFYLALTLMMAGAAIGKFGLDTTLMRFAGSAAQAGDMATVRGLYRQAGLLSSLIAIAVTAPLFVGADWLASALFDDPQLQPVIMMLALAVTPFSLIWVQSGVLKAVSRPVAATWVESALLPILMAVATVTLAGLDLLSPLRAAAIYTALTFIVYLAGSLIYLRGPQTRGTHTLQPWPRLVRTALPLAMVDVMNFLMAWAIIPILGSVAPESEVGIYNAAHRLTIQLSIVLVVFGGIMAPRFADHHARGDYAGLEALAARTTLLMSLVALPAGLLFLGWPGMVGLIFGAEYASGGLIVQILAVGQLYNLVSGPAGYLLVMTGHQHSMRNILAGTLLVTLPLIALLGRDYGAVGAAIGVSFGLVLQNTLALWAVYRHLGIIGIPGMQRRPRSPLETTS